MFHNDWHARFFAVSYFLLDRFFVPTTEKQLQMTGRLWRHGLCMMPHMMAGVGGPESEAVRHTDAAPTAPAAREARSSDDQEELDDGHGPGGALLEAAEEIFPEPQVPDVVLSAKYRRLHGTLPLHKAVLDVYCRMALLGGRLMGDNMADTTRMTEDQMHSLAEEA